MKKHTQLFAIFLSAVFLLGTACSKKEVLETNQSSEIEIQRNPITKKTIQIELMENEIHKEVQPEDSDSSIPKFSLDDFCLIDEHTGIVFKQWDNMYDIEGYDTEKVAIKYERPDKDEYTWLEQRINDLYFVWVKKSGYIITLITENSRYVTGRGIKVGDTSEKVLKAYGKDASWIDDKQIAYGLGNKEFETMCCLTFYLKDGFVNQIEITCGD